MNKNLLLSFYYGLILIVSICYVKVAITHPGKVPKSNDRFFQQYMANELYGLKNIQMEQLNNNDYEYKESNNHSLDDENFPIINSARSHNNLDQEKLISPSKKYKSEESQDIMINQFQQEIEESKEQFNNKNNYNKQRYSQGGQDKDVLREMRKKESITTNIQLKQELISDSDESSSDNMNMRKLQDTETYCIRCERLKPPRTHHCSQCELCVLRMDHHCNWIGNCIGFMNYRYFLQLLFYTSIILIIQIVCHTIYCLSFEGLSEQLDKNLTRFLARNSNFVFSIFLFATLIHLLGVHLNLISKNLTTIENHCEDKDKYNKGSKMKNFKSILGPNVIYWFVPLSQSQFYQ